MFLFDRQKSRLRRVDPRKLRVRGLRERLAAMFAHPRSIRQAGILALLCGGSLLLMYLPGGSRYRENEPVRESVYARVAFSYEDRDATREAQEKARLGTPAVYKRDYAETRRLQKEFVELLTAAMGPAKPAEPPAAAPPGPGPSAPAAQPPPKEPPAEKKPEGDQTEEARKAEEARQAAEAAAAKSREELLQKWNLKDELGQLAQIAAADTRQAEALAQKFNAVLAEINKLAILGKASYITEIAGPQTNSIYIFDDGEYEKRDKKSLLNAKNTDDRDAFQRLLATTTRREFAGERLTPALLEKLQAKLLEAFAPNLAPDDALTKAKQEEAAAQVLPVVRRFSRDDRMVAKDRRLGPQELSILKAEQQAYDQKLTWYLRLSSRLGSAVLIGLLVFLMVAYVVLYQRNVIERVMRGFVLVVLFLLVAATAKLLYANAPQTTLIFPVTTAAMIVAIAYNRQMALALTWLMILMVTLVMRLGDYDTMVLLIVGASTAVLQLHEVRSRSKLIRVGLVAGLVYVITVWALKLMWTHELDWSMESFREALGQSGLAFLAGLLPGFIVLGLLPAIERVFNIVTSISLLELCDVNQPALRQLAVEAPGTYSHSLLLGSIVEPAAEAIGANGLLARVGAYFHDIGKANKPQYFAENRDQLAHAVDHHKLTPQMSKLIITSHIKDGLEMAEQYRLPRAINAFIAEHHGTTVIEYFYHEARKFGETFGDTPVAESEFRYAGPKPQSKETAILMLADSCEGAVRSIKDPTPNKIEDKIHEIVMKRLLDGQLDESGMTLNDVRKVKESLTRSLISVYHGRIAYPEPQERGQAAAPEPAGAGP